LTIIKIIVNLIKLVRARHWFPQLKTSLIFALIYAFFLQNSGSYVQEFLIFIFYQANVLICGFMLNSVYDKELDLKAGKDFALESFPKWFIVLIIVASGIISLFFPMLFGLSASIIGLATFFLGTYYSAKPFRLKTKGIAGLLATSFAPAALPFLFLVAIVNEQVMFGIFIAMALFLRQFIGETAHQFRDYDNDKKSNTKTFAVFFGKENTKTLAKTILIVYIIYLFGGMAFGLEVGLMVVAGILITSTHELAYIVKF